MKYITGIYGLNIEDSTEACGDWHTSALNWKNVRFEESNHSIFGDYGIETGKEIPESDLKYNVANTIRCILDIMVKGDTGYLKGFRNDFLCTDIYNKELFDKVLMLRGQDNWEDINSLMQREFMFEWDRYLEENGIACEHIVGEYKEVPSSNDVIADFIINVNRFARTNNVKYIEKALKIYKAYREIIRGNSMASSCLTMITADMIRYYSYGSESSNIVEDYIRMVDELGIRV